MAVLEPLWWDWKMKNHLREIRENKGMTLERVAELAGTTNQQIHRLETGKRKLTLEWVDRLAHALGVKPGEILPRLGQESELMKSINLLEDQEKQMLETFVQSLLHKKSADKKEQ